MALVAKCARKSEYLKEAQFQAFVVDHGARKGSDEEARKVAEAVTLQGISRIWCLVLNCVLRL